MSTPALSVVVPAYQNAAFIDETMDSILSQDFDDFEVIVADHSSTDGTWDRLQRLADHPRVRLLRTPKGGGAPRNFNRVSGEARGRYLKLVCGDDILLPGILRRQVELLESNPGAVLTAGPRQIIDARGKIVLRSRGLGKLRSPAEGGEAIRATVRAGANLFGEPGSVTMVRSVLADEGNWFFDYPYLVDEATYVRVLQHGHFVPDLVVGAAFRLNAEQTSMALAKYQHEQVRAFHAWLRASRPDVISDDDVRVGDRNARITALKRRLAYAVLSRRM